MTKDLILYLEYIHSKVGDEYLEKIVFYPQKTPYSILSMDFRCDFKIILTTINTSGSWFIETQDQTLSGVEVDNLILQLKTILK